MNRPLLLVLALAVALAGTGCRRKYDPNRPLRVGFLTNLTHAQALIGSSDGTFGRALGKPIDVKKFSAGPAAMEALLAGELDVVYVGGAPAVNLFVRSKGAAVVVAGAASGGSLFVTRGGISSPQGLKGKRLASPQLGNTQDLALRTWLRGNGLNFEPPGADVMVTAMANADILNAFKRGDLDGAWVPEPWATRLILETGAQVFVDERTLWTDGRLPTTVVMASRDALTHRRADVVAIVRAHVDLTARAHQDPADFAKRANKAFGEITGKPLKPEVLSQAMSRIDFLTDPMAAQLSRVAEQAKSLGYLPTSDVTGLVDDSLLREASRTAPAAP